MAGRVRAITGHSAEPLADGWELAACAPDEIAGPGSAGLARLDWLACGGPKPAAAALRDLGRWSLDGPPRRFDAEDWWYRLRFATAPAAPGEEAWLCLDGLATVAEAWLNGEPLLTSTGMFTAHERRVDALLRPENELLLHFRSLDGLLSARRPRPHWRTPMVAHQQLRWFRTTLLGRTPGWSPPAAVVGPWRGVRLERRRGVDVRLGRLVADADGTVEVACEVRAIDGLGAGAVSLVLERGGRTHRATLEAGDDNGSARGRLVVPAPALWWPHTHGEPALYAARLEVQRAGGIVAADLGAIGFRSVALDAADGRFALRVNAAPVFCRGACWTPLDPVSFANDPLALRAAFDRVVDAGMNMLRVGGTMVYETDAFLDACDAEGVLLWQDFMFANLDYPSGDAGFDAEVAQEARQVLGHLRGRPSLALLCGNSEGEQQAAMWGASRERWHPPLFHQVLPSLANAEVPDVPYWPSSASGGAFPHQSSAGSSSYYGVGAYLRPLEDARRAEVRFASECLAFANIPEPEGLARLSRGVSVRVHEAAWKERAPRDLGAGWDFDDVRDHYLQRLFGVDAAALRYSDHDRYLELGRVVTGEVMAQVFGEWRRKRSPTAGGLVWFLRDLWPGAGWGLVDADGRPKPAWHIVRRALQPLLLHLSDEGGNGIAVHAANDGEAPFRGTVTLSLWKDGAIPVGRGARAIEIPGRGAAEWDATEWFDGFLDLSYAYRFGPPAHDVVAATLADDQGQLAARAFHFIGHLPHRQEADIGLVSRATPLGDGRHQITVTASRFAYAVRLDVAGYAPDDNYFHLAPGEERRIVLRPASPGEGRPRGSVRAINAHAGAQVTFE